MMTDRLALLFTFAISISSPAIAATPRDELLRLAPRDAGFVVVIQDLREHFDRIGKSPFVKLRMTLGKGNDKELKQLAEIDEMMQREVGTSFAKFRDEVVGDAVVLVWRPGPSDRPEGEESVVLVRPRDAKLAASMFEHLDAMQSKSGQLKETETKSHAGQSYKRRVRTDEPDEFQYQRGNILAFGSSESLLKQVIDADVAGGAGTPPIADHLRSLNVEGAALVWWVNPRAFDALFSRKQKNAAGPESLIFGAIEKHWKAVDGVAGYVQLGEGMRMGVAMSGRPDALPATTRQFLSEAAKPSSLADAFPKDALLTICGRFSLPAVIDASDELLPDAARQQLRETTGKTLVAALGPDATAALPSQLGPDWGICVTAPVEANNQVPVVTAAVRLEEVKSGPAVAPRVLDGINAVATFAAIGYNANHADAIALRSERLGEIEVRYFVGDKTFPPGVRPAYAWKHGYLLIASTPDAISAFRAPTSTNPAGPAPMIRISPASWVNYFKTHKAVFAGLIAAQNAEPIETVNERLDAAIAAMQMLNSIDVEINTAANRATIELKVTSKR